MSVAERVHTAVRSAIIDGGQRQIRVEARLPELDPTETDFDRDAFLHLTLRCMRALTVLDGPLLLMLPCMQTLAAAKRAVSAEWPVDVRERLRLTVPQFFGEPTDEDLRAEGVLVAGFVGNGLEDPEHRHACAWLRSASSVALCLNSYVRLQNFELARYETAFAFEPHTVTRDVLRFLGAGSKSRTHLAERIWVDVGTGAREQAARSQSPAHEDVMATEQLGEAMIYRAYPQPWQVFFASEAAQDFEQVAELPARPNDRELTEIVEPIIKARRAALAAALRALRQDSSNTSVGVSKEAESSIEKLGPVSVAGALGVASMSPGTVVCLSWAEVEAKGASEALSLYQAVALLRQRCYGSATSFSNDERGLHIFQPYSADEAAAARARSIASGRLNGDLRGACLLVPDGAGEGVATIEHFALQRDAAPEERSACAAALLARALSEARILNQRYIVVGPLPPLLRVEGARWLADAGFGSVDDISCVAPPQIEFLVRSMAPGARYRPTEEEEA